jgi:probable HAF family extracellular repeat protein
MCYTQNRFKALLSACVLSLIATAGWSQSLTWLGTLGGSNSGAVGVSDDGAVVVGGARNAAGQSRAFRWTAAGGMRDLGTLPGGNESAASAVSADGAVVVGRDWNAVRGYRAFRWTASGGMQDLGTLGGNESMAWDVSADGRVVVGGAKNAAGFWHAFRWTASGGMQDLGMLGGDLRMSSLAFGVSADGTVVVGMAQNAAWQLRAFRWTASGGCKTSARWAAMRARLGVFPPTAPWWSAGLSTPQGRGVPFAGRRRVGCKTSARWAAERARLVVFPPTAPWWSAGLTTPQGARAFRWTASRGMEDLNTTYASLLTDGSELTAAARHLSRWAVYCGVGLQRRHRAHRSLPAGYGLPAARGCRPQRLRGRRRSVALAIRVWREWLPQRRPQLGRHSRRRRPAEVLFNFGSGC